LSGLSGDSGAAPFLNIAEVSGHPSRDFCLSDVQPIFPFYTTSSQLILYYSILLVYTDRRKQIYRRIDMPQSKALPHDSGIKMSNKRPKIDVRLIVQIIFFLLLAIIAVNRYLDEHGMSVALLSTASVHALCPFGGVVSIYSVLTGESLVRKIHQSSMVLMYIGVFLALLVGPAFCGWACPFGSFQEWTGKIGKKIFKKRYKRKIRRM